MRQVAFIIVVLVFELAAVLAAVAQTDVHKILYVDSYHEGYQWSADITAGIQSILGDRDDVALKIFRMDTKRNQSEEFKKRAALEARRLIESWRPDVVIASDDTASNYLIAPYFKGKDLPIVFCGLNWDASVYGFPASNVTGMIEVALYQPTIAALKSYAKGSRIGYLASDTLSERKEYQSIVKLFPADFNLRFVTTFSELKQEFLALQQECDLVLLQELRSVKGFVHEEMVQFVNKNTLVPTGALHRFLGEYALLTYSKLGEEQGKYAAKTALKILAGTLPRDIPVVTNKQAEIYLNMILARKIGVKFPMELIENAHLLGERRKKIFYVNSYHKGYRWSDDIEKGLLKALNIVARADGTFDTSQSEVKLKVFRMNTKLNTSEEFKRQAALSAKRLIDDWQPDVVVASDDNAAKYLIEPYYKYSNIPFVFNGLNWDASVYGFPTNNITGMVEVAPVLETIAMLRDYAQGERIGFIGSKNLSCEKQVFYHKGALGVRYADGELVSTFAEWKAAYSRLQDSVDMILWLNPIGIEGWDDTLAIEFIRETTRVPTGAMNDSDIPYAMIGRVRIAEEQGWWAGKTALEILEGRSPATIPLARNKESRIHVNMPLVNRLGIKLPLEMLERAIFVNDKLQ